MSTNSEQGYNYYNLTPEDIEKISNGDSIKKQICMQLQNRTANEEILDEEEQNLCNFVLVTVCAYDLRKARATTTREHHINGNNIIEDCKKDLELDNLKLVKLLTELFLSNDIFVCTAQKSGPYHTESHPSNPECRDFVDGMSSIFNGDSTYGIFLTRQAEANISKNIALVARYTRQQFNDVTKVINAAKEATAATKEVIQTANTAKEAATTATETAGALKGEIIGIVGLIVAIIPLLTTNLSLLNSNPIQITHILLSNGILLLVIGTIFLLVNQFSNKKICSCGFFIIGTLLIVMAVTIQFLSSNILMFIINS